VRAPRGILTGNYSRIPTAADPFRARRPENTGFLSPSPSFARWVPVVARQASYRAMLDQHGMRSGLREDALKKLWKQSFLGPKRDLADSHAVVDGENDIVQHSTRPADLFSGRSADLPPRRIRAWPEMAEARRTRGVVPDARSYERELEGPLPGPPEPSPLALKGR